MQIQVVIHRTKKVRTKSIKDTYTFIVKISVAFEKGLMALQFNTISKQCGTKFKFVRINVRYIIHYNLKLSDH